MKKYVLFFLCFLSASALGQAETLNLSTYYPAPYGGYSKIRLAPQATLAGSCQPGEMYVDVNHDMCFCQSDGTWGYPPGIWKQTKNMNGDPIIYLTESSPNLKIGVGTKNPSSALDVAGEVRAAGGVKVGTSAVTCDSSVPGTISYNSTAKNVEVCDGSDWKTVGGGGGGQLGVYSSASRPVCDSSKLGLMIFDIDVNRPYVCSKNGMWYTSGWTDKDLVMAVHSSSQCTSSSGTVMDDGNGNKFCKFINSQCLVGWTQYSHWSTTKQNICWGNWGVGCTCMFPCSDNSGQHAWSDSPVDSKPYVVHNQYCQQSSATCSASVLEIGCY